MQGRLRHRFPTHIYNVYGQITNQVDPDGVSTLYAYDAKGEQTLTVVDVNRNYVVDYSLADRITLSTNDVIFDNGYDVQRTRVYAWSTNNSSVPTLVSTAETSTDGLRTWSTAWNSGVPVTRQTTTVYAGSGVAVT